MNNILYWYCWLCLRTDGRAIWYLEHKKIVRGIFYSNVFFILGGFSFNRAHRLAQKYINENYRRRKLLGKES